VFAFCSARLILTRHWVRSGRALTDGGWGVKFERTMPVRRRRIPIRWKSPPALSRPGIGIIKRKIPAVAKTHFREGPEFYADSLGFFYFLGWECIFSSKKVARFFYLRTITRLVRNKTGCKASEI